VDRNLNSIIQKTSPQNVNATRARGKDKKKKGNGCDNKPQQLGPEKKRVQFKEDEDLCEVLFYSLTCDQCSFSTGRRAELERHQREHSVQQLEGSLCGDLLETCCLLGGVLGLGYFFFACVLPELDTS
jgi:hypothetical protein